MGDKPNINYFVCTLGESAACSTGHRFRDVNDLIRQQSESIPDLPAIGFYQVSTSSEAERLEPVVLTFKEIFHGVHSTAVALSHLLNVAARETVGLICSSSPEFLFSWLACIRLGYPVLLIAPECTPSGIASLCQSCAVSTILTDRKHQNLGNDASRSVRESHDAELACILLPFNEQDVLTGTKSGVASNTLDYMIDESDAAYFHHTSGTSSGVPKPIRQSHRGVVGALPAFDGRNEATFTTTPLYHGGPADIFRAWTSSAMIWLFPSQHLPITAANVIRCLERSTKCSLKRETPSIKYFTSVPYVLQMMAASEKGLTLLQSMDLVGVGGAALPRQIGDELVRKNVRLVSRFGSAECGFLLSSHRHYENDKDWQYLRSTQSPDISHLHFELQDDGLSELTVQPDWPHIALSNRTGGSYATSDLFEPHPVISNAWRYHSRADAQLTLITGKKFDPAPVEASIIGSTSLLADVFVFGNDRPYPGALLFRSHEASSLSDKDLLYEVARIVAKLNQASQTHTRIDAGMLIPLPYDASALPKSSKGTILRGKAEQMFNAEIVKAYENNDVGSLQCSDAELPQQINGMIVDMVQNGSRLDNSTDLFSFGIDSIVSMRLRSGLRHFVAKETPQFPVNMIEHYPTVNQLSSYVQSVRHGTTSDHASSDPDCTGEMLALVEQFGTFASHSERSKRDGRIQALASNAIVGEVVVLTGATGALGAHVLHKMKQDPTVSRIYCLARGSDKDAATSRVAKALEQRELISSSPCEEAKVIVLNAKLSDSRLGLDDRTYELLTTETTVIMHLAWPVNFRMRLRSFAKESIGGLRNLLDLALASTQSVCPKFLYCSSVASVANFNGGTIPESIIDDPSTASTLGYSQSKWVAEQICRRASTETGLKGRIAVFRVGQLSGSNKTGIWNTKEAWPLMLSTVKLLGSLPNLGDQVLDWLPIDIAAAAMLEEIKVSPDQNPLRVYHVLNHHTSRTWRDLLVWLKKRIDFEIVTPAQWIQQLEAAALKSPDHPALALLDHWKDAFADAHDRSAPRVSFAMERSRRDLPSLRTVQPVDEEYFGKLWAWIDANMTKLSTRR